MIIITIISHHSKPFSSKNHYLFQKPFLINDCHPLTSFWDILLESTRLWNINCLNQYVDIWKEFSWIIKLWLFKYVCSLSLITQAVSFLQFESPWFNKLKLNDLTRTMQLKNMLNSTGTKSIFPKTITLGFTITKHSFQALKF